MRGDAGADTLNGDAGDDRLFGGDDDDVLIGGAGNDAMNGGEGADTFIFRQGDGNDTITDFEDGIDLIDISDFAGSSTYNIIADPALSATDNAFIIFFATGETLRIESADGSDFTFTSADFIL
ncbi:M10 family metallopeptidase C-terminal domain-containing protein [Planktotalea sp.]|uniref:M10 family metallopeptidase C-terminal domain-containing protein n=1 Tax=Planktotalea sp. TaxID=2029877 RepID=UPI003C780242